MGHRIATSEATLPGFWQGAVWDTEGLALKENAVRRQGDTGARRFSM